MLQNEVSIEYMSALIGTYRFPPSSASYRRVVLVFAQVPVHDNRGLIPEDLQVKLTCSETRTKALTNSTMASLLRCALWVNTRSIKLASICDTKSKLRVWHQQLDQPY